MKIHMLPLLVMTVFLCSCSQARPPLLSDEPITRQTSFLADPAYSVVTAAGIELSIASVSTDPIPNYRPSPGVLVHNPQNAFELRVTNKTRHDVEIVWNETMFVSDGQTNGGFMFEGVVFSRRDEPKQNDVVFPGTTFKKVIFPNILAKYIGVMGIGWKNRPFGAGEFGAYVVLQRGSEKIKQRLTTKLTLLP